jgi:hypothetical protein
MRPFDTLQIDPNTIHRFTQPSKHTDGATPKNPLNKIPSTIKVPEYGTYDLSHHFRLPSIQK